MTGAAENQHAAGLTYQLRRTVAQLRVQGATKEGYSGHESAVLAHRARRQVHVRDQLVKPFSRGSHFCVAIRSELLHAASSLLAPFQARVDRGGLWRKKRLQHAFVSRLKVTYELGTRARRTTAQAVHLAQVAVQLQNSVGRAAGANVQAIDVLRDERVQPAAVQQRSKRSVRQARSGSLKVPRTL
eukprot:CAMPEP_0185841628 /NCGR_PEP_ID=MMETSP1353-20130828/17993_1 /TAXON_ID=1077150 /ORGANISM="Erythrolobus australicus, Strain CCMP3124" /LENGTH=185 /DNA_ID=CAMNT_0028541109 /DNA_START=820 /DNA_END=1377 /DNA_ORIENTATION=+